ncbi:hypothetical protein LCGC14_0666790 [marine sediment metagenome]|uniref:Uncharacterized protein n=1 Tax=marine sediment metagenome TaxID=412755 RepID=A0A0F9QS25_9ZZZZ
MTLPGKTWKDQKRKRQGRKVRTQSSNVRLNELANERALKASLEMARTRAWRS